MRTPAGTGQRAAARWPNLAVVVMPGRAPIFKGSAWNTSSVELRAALTVDSRPSARSTTCCAPAERKAGERLTLDALVYGIQRSARIEENRFRTNAPRAACV